MLKKVLLYFCLINTTLISDSVIYSNNNDFKQESISDYNMELKNEYYNLLREEVDKYISDNSKNSKVKTDTIIDLCVKHNFDIGLLLAQAHLEGNFGTKGRTKTTNSVFGVGLWDNGVNKNKYDNPNKSIEPYIILVKNKYLSKYGTTDNLLKNGYKNQNGHYYASDTKYSVKVSSLIKNIRKKTNIYYYYEKLLDKDIYIEKSV